MAKTDERHIGDLLIQSLQEALAIARGEKEPVRVNSYPLSARRARVPPPPGYGGEDVRRIREGLGLSQSVFGQLLNASVNTVKAWERGVRTPDGPSLRLLEMAEKHPDLLLELVRKHPAPDEADSQVRQDAA